MSSGGLAPCRSGLGSDRRAVGGGGARPGQVVMVLWNLSINPDNKVRMVEKGALPGLVALLRSPEERIQVRGGGGARGWWARWCSG